jgi:hypothetical protein
MEQTSSQRRLGLLENHILENQYVSAAPKKEAPKPGFSDCKRLLL